MRELKKARNPFSDKLMAVVCFLVTILFCRLSVRAQDEEQKGVDQGNYNIKQSIEFGGRFTSIGGDTQTYDTFVNLQQGPRLLGFTTEMQSLDHHNTFFDKLYFSNFGYGGDPNEYRVCASPRTNGTTSTRFSAATRTLGTTRCRPTP